VSALRAAWIDYREAVSLFSRPARLLLVTELLAWICHGIFAVAFNLYLLEGGFRESFVGQAISLNGLGMALASLPAGLLADRWGRRRCLILGAVLDAVAQFARATFLAPEIILAGSFVAGVGQALLAIAAAPFMTEHSTPRERTHLFSTFFAATLLAGVIGSILGGEIPAWLGRLGGPLRADGLHAFRGALWVGALLMCAAVAIIVSTANAFLLSPSTSLARDVVQRFLAPGISDARLMTVQRIFIVLLAILACTMLRFYPSVLAMAFTAYTFVGAGLTPAILAAFLWKRATAWGGVASIAGGMMTTLAITIVNGFYEKAHGRAWLETDYIVIPAALCSVALLVIVSLSGPPPPDEKWRPFFD